MITKQGLEASLYTILEFGYKACERGDNLQAVRSEVKAAIDALVADSGLKSEILRVMAIKQAERT